MAQGVVADAESFPGLVGVATTIGRVSRELSKLSGVNLWPCVQRMNLLISVRQTKQHAFAPVWPKQLQTDRQAFLGKSARDANAGNAGEVRSHSVNIVEIHRQGIVNFLSETKCRRW